MSPGREAGPRGGGPGTLRVTGWKSVLWSARLAEGERHCFALILEL